MQYNDLLAKQDLNAYLYASIDSTPRFFRHRELYNTKVISRSVTDIDITVKTIWICLYLFMLYVYTIDISYLIYPSAIWSISPKWHEQTPITGAYRKLKIIPFSVM